MALVSSPEARLRVASRSAALAVALAVVLALTLSAGAALAHKTNLSTSLIGVEGADVRYELAVGAHDLAVAVGIETDLVAPVPRAAFAAKARAIEAYVASRLRLSADGAACRAQDVATDYARLPQEVVLRLSFRCPDAMETLLVAYTVFFDVDPRHRGIGSIDTGLGTEEFLFEPGFTEIAFEVARPAPPRPFIERATRFVGLGFGHILTGYDHLLFVFALLLVSTRFLHLVTVVTAFTLAHSVTLSLAWFGFIDLPSRLVESLIALSIAYVAAENLLGHKFGRRWMVAFGFGLVHGLGFWGVLRGLDLGGGALAPLLGFNLGVEIGQIAVISVAWPLLALAFRRPWYPRAMRAASLAIVVVGGAWFVQRAFLG